MKFEQGTWVLCVLGGLAPLGILRSRGTQDVVRATTLAIEDRSGEARVSFIGSRSLVSVSTSGGRSAAGIHPGGFGTTLATGIYLGVAASLETTEIRLRLGGGCAVVKPTGVTLQMDGVDPRSGVLACVDEDALLHVNLPIGERAMGTGVLLKNDGASPVVLAYRASGSAIAVKANKAGSEMKAEDSHQIRRCTWSTVDEDARVQMFGPDGNEVWRTPKRD